MLRSGFAPNEGISIAYMAEIRSPAGDHDQAFFGR